jgi:hypothetical protein
MSALVFASRWLATIMGTAELCSPMLWIWTISAWSHGKMFVEKSGAGQPGMPDLWI